MKTPEEMAEEYINHVLESQCDCSYRIAFLAGYQAAKDSAAIDTNSIDSGTKMQWISVKDRLPEINKGFIGFVENQEVCNCNRYANCRTDGGPVFYAQTKEGLLICGLESITHWMPLPKPPEGEG